MTREEALNNLYGLSEKSNPEFVDSYAVERLIDEIYDDFEKQCANCKFFGNDNGESWEEGYKQCLKERVCENCIYANLEFNWCDNEENKWKEGAYYKTIKIKKDFGCNKFKRKTK